MNLPKFDLRVYLRQLLGLSLVCFCLSRGAGTATAQTFTPYTTSASTTSGQLTVQWKLYQTVGAVGPSGSNPLVISISGPASQSATFTSYPQSSSWPVQSWIFTGLPPGTYTVSSNAPRSGSTGWVYTMQLAAWDPSPPPAPNIAPTISWVLAPATAASGQAYTVSAHGHDDDGNLTQVNVWKNGLPFASAGGGDGTDGNSGSSTSDTGPQTINFTAQAVDADGATSPVITQVITIDPPANTPPTVTLVAPGGQTVTAGTTLTITSHATDPDGNIMAHNLDIQRPAGDWNFQGGFATGAPFQGGPVGSGGDSTRTAGFTFTDVGTYQVRSAANDGSGWVQSATVTITVVALPPVQYSFVTAAGAGGTVSPGGNFNAGTVVTVSAVPDSTHDFAGWSGDAVGTGNPVSLTLDRNKAVQANFTPKLFALTTSATTGGNVTPGGSYAYGTSVTVSAAPDAAHRFIGWAGDASGSAPSILVTLTVPLNVQAVFTDKTAQTVTFGSPGNQPAGGPAFPLGGSASSGLPITYTVLSGPAMVVGGNQLQIIGPGAITVQAGQPGDGTYLPAANIIQTFNAVAAAFLKYRPAGRTLLQTTAITGAAPFVLENP